MFGVKLSSFLMLTTIFLGIEKPTLRRTAQDEHAHVLAKTPTKAVAKNV